TAAVYTEDQRSMRPLPPHRRGLHPLRRPISLEKENPPNVRSRYHRCRLGATECRVQWRHARSPCPGGMTKRAARAERRRERRAATGVTSRSGRGSTMSAAAWVAPVVLILAGVWA